MRFVAGGEAEETQESVRGLFAALGVAVLGIYALLILLFNSLRQPFMVMMAMPFGMIGVVWAFGIHGEPLGFLAMMGVIGLMGVVVNDSLVLVDFVNKARAEGLSIRQAVIDAGAKRLRPVLLTSTTTIAGLLPMTMGWFGSEEFLQPMAVTIVWGLVFSTVLILLLVPCVVLFVDAMRRLVSWPFRALRRVLSRPEPTAPAADAGAGS